MHNDIISDDTTVNNVTYF